MLEKEYVLADMKKYSVFYSYLKFANSDEKNLNRIIVILKYLKADDVFPLYLYLIERMYSSDKKELCRILTLVKDFVLRYRIVTPSSGGGSLNRILGFNFFICGYIIPIQIIIRYIAKNLFFTSRTVYRDIFFIFIHCRIRSNPVNTASF